MEHMDYEINTLRDVYHQKVKTITTNWFYKAEPLLGLKEAVQNYGILKKSPKKDHLLKKDKKISRKSLKNKIREKNNKKE